MSRATHVTIVCEIKRFNHRTIGFVPLTCPLGGGPVAARFVVVAKWAPDAYKSYRTMIKTFDLAHNCDMCNVAQP